MDIKLCSFNVNGLGNQSKREKIFSWLKQNKFNICFLQELHCTPLSTDKWKREWGQDIYLSGNSSNSVGIGILINLNIAYETIYYSEIIPGRLQLLKLKIYGLILTFINV